MSNSARAQKPACHLAGPPGCREGPPHPQQLRGRLRRARRRCRRCPPGRPCPQPRSAMRCRSTPSAVGERQMLPRHTNSTRVGTALNARRCASFVAASSACGCRPGWRQLRSGSPTHDPRPSENGSPRDPEPSWRPARAHSGSARHHQTGPRPPSPCHPGRLPQACPTPRREPGCLPDRPHRRTDLPLSAGSISHRPMAGRRRRRRRHLRAAAVPGCGSRSPS